MVDLMFKITGFIVVVIAILALFHLSLTIGPSHGSVLQWAH